MPLILAGATSGSATVQATDAATVTLTLPATSGTLAVGGTTPTFTSLTVTNDASISGLTVGKGGGAISTNTAVGASALLATSTDGNNTGLGYQALTANTSGYANTGVGQGSLLTNTSGYSNTAVGKESLKLNTTGSSNTALGRESLYSNTTASNNTAVGLSLIHISEPTRPY